MLVIPAIDVSAGRLTRMDAGERRPVDAFAGDPVAAATTFVGAGARWLHVVDVDLAFTGELSDLSFLRRIAALGVPVQASGGVADARVMAAMFDSGASRVVLASAALYETELVEAVLAEFGDRLVLGLETESGLIRARRAPRNAAPVGLAATAQRLASAGAHRFLCTNVGRVGSLGGVDLAGVRAVVAAAPAVPAIVSGGVRDAADIRRIATELPDLEAIVVGRALYEGSLSLEAASEAAGP